MGTAQIDTEETRKRKGIMAS
jgi:hypothetical protein